MAFIQADANGTLNGATVRVGGQKSYTLTDAGHQTEIVWLDKGETCFIHINMTGACTVEVLGYVTPGGTGIALDYNGATSFTADTALTVTAAGKMGVSVNMSVDGGSTVVTITK